MEKYKELFDKLFSSINNRLLFLEEKNIEKEVLNERVTLLNELVECFELTDYAAIGVELDNISRLINKIFTNGEYQNLFRDLVRNVNAFNTYVSNGVDLYSDEIKRVITFINEFKSRLIVDLSSSENKLKEYDGFSREDIVKYKNILRSFKCDCPLTDVELEMLSKDVIEKEFEFNDQIRLFENIRMFNSNSVLTDDSISILNMVDFGYEEIELPVLEDSEKKKLSFIVGGYASLMDSSMFDFEEFSNDVVLDDKNYSLNGFSFVIDSLLLKLQDKIYEVSSFYDEKGFYLDENLRTECVKEFNKYVELYNMLRDYRENSISLYKSEKYEDLIEEDAVNNLYFAFPGDVDENSVSYFEKDLKDVPEEYLSRVGSLLFDFKKGILTKKHIETFSGNDIRLNGYKKLKSDFIRILVKHISENNHLIVGVFVKKKMSDYLNYPSMTKRNTNVDVNNPLMGIEVEKRIVSYVSDNKRVSSR